MLSATTHNAVQSSIPRPPLPNGPGIDTAIDTVLDRRALAHVFATAVAARGHVGGTDKTPVFTDLRTANFPAELGGGGLTAAAPALLADFGRAAPPPQSAAGPGFASTPLGSLTPPPQVRSSLFMSLAGAFRGEASPERPRSETAAPADGLEAPPTPSSAARTTAAMVVAQGHGIALQGQAVAAACTFYAQSIPLCYPPIKGPEIGRSRNRPIYFLVD